jgi:hypothetical protein
MGPPGAEIDPRRVLLDGRSVDVTRPGTIPPGHCLKAFALLPDAEVGVAYPARAVGIALRLTAACRAWLGVWVNAQGFPAEAPVAHLALEPSFGDSDVLSEAAASGTCLVVPAGAAFEWSLVYEICLL